MPECWRQLNRHLRALGTVAFPAERLQVIRRADAATRDGDDVVDLDQQVRLNGHGDAARRVLACVVVTVLDPGAHRGRHERTLFAQVGSDSPRRRGT